MNFQSLDLNLLRVFDVVMAERNLTRAAATISGPALAKATTATIRRKLIAVPARHAYSARRTILHLPKHWPWQDAWSQLFTRACGPPSTTKT